jgi:hypothetical protein
MRNRNTIEFLGLWEKLHNPNFNRVQFEAVRSEAGYNRFVMTPTKWIEAVNAIGIVSKAGRYGGTYAHSDIAMSFATWISPEFQLYIMKDYRRLKADENSRLSLGWNLNREIANLNQLLVLANMESYNAVLIEQGKEQAERLVLLRELAVRQMETLASISMDNLSQLTGGEILSS